MPLPGCNSRVFQGRFCLKREAPMHAPASAWACPQALPPLPCTGFRRRACGQMECGACVKSAGHVVFPREVTV
jgi:hypothetical protein